MNGAITPTAGTSASTPTMAAIITLLNEIRLAKGQSPLGFINPFLYKLARVHPEVFHDVVVGENRCTVNDMQCCPVGFKATPGFDVVSGLGAPRFKEIANLLLNEDAIFSYLPTSDANNNNSNSADKLSYMAILMSALAIALSSAALAGWSIASLCSKNRGDGETAPLLYSGSK